MKKYVFIYYVSNGQECTWLGEINAKTDITILNCATALFVKQIKGDYEIKRIEIKKKIAL